MNLPTPRPDSAHQRSLRGEKERLVAGRILAAGRTAFSLNGLYATRVEEITDLAGVAKGTFYLYYSSKEELIRAVAEDSFGALRTRCHQATEGAADWHHKLTLVISAHFDFFGQHPEQMRILHQVRGMLKFNQPEWNGLRGALLRHLDDLRHLLVSPPSLPSLTADGAFDLARALFGAISGVVSVWAASADPDRQVPPPPALVHALAELALAFAVGEPAPQEAPSG